MKRGKRFEISSFLCSFAQHSPTENTLFMVKNSHMFPFQLRVKQVVQETPTAVTLVFDDPMLDYLPGQFLTLQLAIGGETIERAYSFCTTPYTDRYPSITIKKIPQGRGSTYLCTHVRAGDILHALPAAGRFTLPPQREKGRYLICLAGGSGITPLFSMIKAALYTEPHTTVYLLDANRTPADIIYFDALTALQERYQGRLHVTHILSQAPADWEGYQGRLDKPLLQEILYQLPQEPSKDYLLCGPQGLMDLAAGALQEMGVHRQAIHQESFTPAVSPQGGNPVTYELIIHEPSHRHLCRPSTDQTLLESALEAGVDIPYACLSGTCNTCRAKCTEGKVTMDEDEGLTEQELAEGYVLTCVARPASERVVITLE